MNALDLALKVLDGAGIRKLETGADVLDGSKGIVERCNDGLEEAKHGGGGVRRDGWGHAGWVGGTLLVKERRRSTRTNTLSSRRRRSLNTWWVGSCLWRSDWSRHVCYVIASMPRLQASRNEEKENEWVGGGYKSDSQKRVANGSKGNRRRGEDVVVW